MASLVDLQRGIAWMRASRWFRDAAAPGRCVVRCRTAAATVVHASARTVTLCARRHTATAPHIHTHTRTDRFAHAAHANGDADARSPTGRRRSATHAIWAGARIYGCVGGERGRERSPGRLPDTSAVAPQDKRDFVVQRVDASLRFTGSVVEFLNERAGIEQEYAQRLKAAADKLQNAAGDFRTAKESYVADAPAPRRPPLRADARARAPRAGRR